MSLSVDPLSIILFVTLAQGLFILSVLVARYKLKPPQHLALFILLLTLLWLQAEFLSVRLPYDIHWPLFYGTRYGAWLLVGPLFYFYVRSVVKKEIAFSWVDILHLAPFVIFVWIIPPINGELLSSRQVNYGMLTTFDPFNDSVSFLQYVYGYVFITQFFHLLLYLIKAFFMVRNYETMLKGNYSSLEIIPIRWLITLNILLGLVLVLVAFFLVLFFFRRSYNRDLDYLYVIPTALFIYVIGYRLAGVEWLSAAKPAGKTSKYEKSSLKADQAKMYSAQLELFMAQAKPHLNNELRLQDLADLLHIPSHHLSQVINEQLHTTFFEYINRYRIEEAKKLILDEPDSSMLEIAFKAGFNNKTSFTNAFKKFTTQTPVGFKQLHRRQ